MTKQELRDYCQPLMILKTISDCQKMLDKFSRFFMVVINKHHHDPVTKQSEADLKIILQTLFSKTIYIQDILNGINYSCKDYVKKDIGGGAFRVETFSMNPIIDPTILATQVRCVFETVCAFEIIYHIPDNDEKKNIIYYLFQIEGLRYQARFYKGQTDANIIRIRDKEQKQIDDNITYIKNTQTYKNLDAKNKAKLDKVMNEKNFRETIVNGKVRLNIAWREIPEMFNLKHDLFKDIYTHFSAYAHPSYISIRNYGEMFNKENPQFIEFAIMEINFCLTLLSIFIGDYFKIFPNVKNTYLTIPIEDQILLNFHNKLIRGDNFSFSNAWQELED